jgi:hypothetical protein
LNQLPTSHKLWTVENTSVPFIFISYSLSLITRCKCKFLSWVWH